MRILVLHIVELLDQLLKRTHFLYALYHQFHALLDLLDLARILLAGLLFELLKLPLQLFNVEGIDDYFLAASEEGFARVEQPDVFKDSAVLIADVFGHEVRVFGERAADDYVVEEGQQDYELVGK